MKKLAPALFSVPKPPTRTLVSAEKAEAFVQAETPAATTTLVETETPAPSVVVEKRDTVTVPSILSSGLKSGMARLSVDIPCSTLRALKIRAVESGTTVREYVLGLLERDGLTQR